MFEETLNLSILIIIIYIVRETLNPSILTSNLEVI